MSFILVILLGVGAVAGLVLRRQGQAAGTGLLVACSVLAVGLAVGRLVSSARQPETYETIVSQLETTHRVMATELGRYLAGEGAGTRAVCLFSPVDENEAVIRAGLEEGLEGSIPVEFVRLQRQGNDPALDILSLTPAQLVSVLDAHPGTDLVISMVNLPWDPGPLAAILRQRGAKLAAGNVLEPGALAPYVQAGVFAGAAAFRDDPLPFEAGRKATAREIFDAHYVLLPAQGG